jgi:hypothetical protein
MCRRQSIGRQEDLEARFRGASQQLPVSEPSPALLLNRADFMAKEFLCQLSRQLLIEQDAHASSVPRGLLRARPRPVHATRGKRVEKIVEAVAPLEIVDQVTKGPRAFR